MKRDHYVGRSWWAPLAELELWRDNRRTRKAHKAAERAAPAQTAPRAPEGILGGLRTAALALVAVLVIAASLVSFAESYCGLYLWAHRHGLTGIWAAIWPLQVDVFIAVGELALFVALVDQWKGRQRVAAWLVTLAGLAVSVAGNIGHVAGHSLTVRATAAVPPLAAASALAVGLGVLKRVVERRHQQGAPDAFRALVPGDVENAAIASLKATLAAGNPWSGRQLETRFGLTRAQATRVRELVLAESNGHLPGESQDNTDQ
jgi:hypothetical protein